MWSYFNENANPRYRQTRSMLIEAIFWIICFGFYQEVFWKIIETQCFSEVLKAFDVPMKTLFFFCFKWESFFHLGFGIKFQWIRFSYSLQNVKDTAFVYLTVIEIFCSCCPLRIGFCHVIYVNILLALLVASFLSEELISTTSEGTWFGTYHLYLANLICAIYTFL